MANKKLHKIGTSILFTLAPAVAAGILASTLMIPTKKNADQETLDNFNDILNKASTTPATMSDAIKILKDKQIDLECQSPTEAQDQYVFDSKVHQLLILKNDGTVRTCPSGYTLSEKNNIWKMVTNNQSNILKRNASNVYSENFSSTSLYSQYLRSDVSWETSLANPLQFVSGIDTGSANGLYLQMNVASETPSNETVIINATNGNLSLSTDFSKVEQIGLLHNLTVTDVEANASINVKGTISGNVELKTATTLIAEPTSTINYILVETTGSSIQVQATSSTAHANVGTIATTDKSTIDLDQVVSTSSEIPEEEQPEVIKDEDKPVPSSTDLSGLGTEYSPYVVTCKEDFTKIDQHKDKYCWYKYANTNKEIDGSNWETNGLYGTLNGSFDGNGLTVNHLSRPLFETLGDKSNSADTNVHSISNVTLNCEICFDGCTSGLVKNVTTHAKFENVEIHGYISGTLYVGGFVSMGPGNIFNDGQHAIDWEFINCHNDAIITATGSKNDTYVSGFVGYHFSTSDSTSKLKITDSYFNGYLTANADLVESTPSSHFAYFSSGTIWNSIHVCTKYTDATTSKLGATPEELGFYTLPSEKETIGDEQWFYVGQSPADTTKGIYNAKEGYTYQNHRSQLDQTTGTEPAQKAQVLTATKVEGATSCIAQLLIGPNNKQDTGNYVKPFVTESITLPENVGDTITTSLVKNYNIRVNDTASGSEQGIHGDYYDVWDNNEFYGHTYGGALVLITQYKTINGVEVPIHATTYYLSK